MFKKWKNVVTKNAVWIISLLAAADVLVFVFPSYLKNVISSEIIALNLGISPAQLAQATAVNGYISLAIYFFGSIIGDKFSLKWLTITGLAVFGLTGAWYGSVGLTYGGGIEWDSENEIAILNSNGQQARFIQVVAIYSIWAFAKLIFWAPLWKLLSQQGKPQDNGILNGIHGSLNGFIGTVFVGIGYVVFLLLTPIFVNKDTTSAYPFTIMCWLFCILILATTILLIINVKEKKEDKIKSDFSFKDTKAVLKNWKIWVLSFVVMGVYMYQMGLSVLVPFMSSALLISATVVFVGGLLRTYIFRLIFSVPAGRLADKSGKYIRFLMIGTIIATGLMAVVMFLPGFKAGAIHEMSSGYKIFVQVIVYAFFLTLGAVCWGLVTNRWATIYEIGVPQKQYSTTVGLVSCIAFSPDAWFFQVNAVFLEKYKKVDNTITGGYNYQLAYQFSMVVIVAGGIIGIIAAILLMSTLKREGKKVVSNSNNNTAVILEKTLVKENKVVEK